MGVGKEGFNCITPFTYKINALNFHNVISAQDF